MNLYLDKNMDYVTEYTASVLEAIPRINQRGTLGITEESLPFRGTDFWNGYDFSWLNPAGVPEVALIQLQFPCSSPRMVESKSLKVYLGSFAQTHFDRRKDVIASVEVDLTELTGGPVNVSLVQPDQVQGTGLGTPNGRCLDLLDITLDEYFWNPEFLQISSDVEVRESVYSHLLRTICPVTGQPDLASLQIQYQGRTISEEGLLRYVVSYRQHAEFCEQVIERIFVDIMNRCHPDRLSVQARYTRRGGLDINPFRTLDENTGVDVRLWRQ